MIAPDPTPEEKIDVLLECHEKLVLELLVNTRRLRRLLSDEHRSPLRAVVTRLVGGGQDGR